MKRKRIATKPTAPPNRRRWRTLLLILAVATIVGAVWAALLRRPADPAHGLLSAWNSGADAYHLEIRSPLDGSLFPSDIAAPTFRWNDAAPKAKRWCLVIEFADAAEPVTTFTSRPQWQPSEELWQQIKRRSLDHEATVTVMGTNLDLPATLLSAGRSTFQTSPDQVAAPILFRDVPLPFVYAVRNPETIRWRLGDVSSRNTPPVLLQNLPVCANCHSCSLDGRLLGMDVDYANDKGSYAITPIQPKTVLDRSRIITWNDYRREDGVRTFGLLSQVSPDGRYVVSTVKDRSVFVPRADLTYSQLFFPIRGILAVYDRQTQKFSSLPGADDATFVQSNPSWSPDGKYLVFARAKAIRLPGEETIDDVLIPERLARDFLEGKRGFQFDLYRIPFNEGRGGTPEPIPGASNNKMSNFFPRISPDGQWLVFTMAKNFMLLQPDSSLYIMPAAGGAPRKMNCNTTNMNSWHSWSPNSRWLVFSSKSQGPYTRLFLTHVDQQGRDTPPVLLESLALDNRAANIPEFVNIPRGAMASIAERFLNDYNFHRRADETASIHGDFEHAVAYYQKALALSPQDAEVRTKLAYAFLMLGRKDAAAAQYARAVQDGPSCLPAHLGLANCYLQTDRLSDAISAFQSILQRWPKTAEAHQNLGVALFQLGNPAEAADHCRQALEIEPDLATAHLNLGVILADLGQSEPSRRHLEAALKCDPLKIADCLLIAQRLADVPGFGQKVKDLLARVLDANPTCAPAYVLLGQIHLNDKNLPESLRCLETAYKIDPRADWLKRKIDELTALLNQRAPDAVNPPRN